MKVLIKLEEFAVLGLHVWNEMLINEQQKQLGSNLHKYALSNC